MLTCKKGSKIGNRIFCSKKVEGSKSPKKNDDVIYEWLQNLIPKMDPKMAYQITTAASSIKG